MKIHLKGALKMNHAEANTEKNKPGADNELILTPTKTTTCQPLAAIGSEEKAPACGTMNQNEVYENLDKENLDKEMILDDLW